MATFRVDALAEMQATRALGRKVLAVQAAVRTPFLLPIEVRDYALGPIQFRPFFP